MPAATTSPRHPNANPAPLPVAGDLSGKLGWYYTRIFPVAQFTRWLRYGSDETLSRREISFTLPGDIYLRWKSFCTPEQFLNSLKSLTPIKMDIGAIYNYPPADKNSAMSPLTPMAKELVFDIDMTDYEDVMGNLAGGSAVEVCDRNWPYMATAVKVIDAALRQDFGFLHILWVYSGRRGIHCWVADARARRMTNEQRSAIADYLYLRFEGRENAGRRQQEVTVPLHPSLARAKRVACEKTFREFVLTDQGMLDSDDRLRNMLATIPNTKVADGIYQRLGNSAGMSGPEKWDRIEKEIFRAGKSDYGVRAAADYIMLKHTYPRLDVNVSREINHLLKAPFCVHPKTGRVCVPFIATEVDTFLPGKMAPEIGRLLAEMREVDGEVRGSGPESDLMKEAVKVFEQFVNGVEGEARAALRKEKLNAVDQRQAAEMLVN